MIIAKCIKDTDPYSGEKLEIDKDKEYEVDHIEMSQSHTSIYLKGFKGYFNSICFTFIEDGKPLDIYLNDRFNPYLKLRK